MNAILVLVVCSSALVAAVSSDYATPMAYARPTAYAQLTYSAPSYDVHDVTKVVDYDYAVNDYYGNEQTRQEHVEPGKQVGHWTSRMADGAMQSVTYEANDYGYLAHVVITKDDYSAPAYSAPVKNYAAPSYTAPSYSVPSYSAPAYSAPSYSAPSYSAPSYSAPSYSAPSYSAHSYSAPSYSAPAYSAPSYVAPKMHYNYEEKNIYVPQTYAAPQTYTAPMRSYSSH